MSIEAGRIRVTAIVIALLLVTALAAMLWSVADRQGVAEPAARALVPAPGDWALLPAEAVPVIRDAVERCRSAPDASALTDLGRLYHGNGQPALAAAAYERALDLGASDPTTPYLLALIQGQWGQTDAALASLSLSIERDPSYAPAWYHVGMNRLESSDVSGAVDALQRAVLLDEREPMYQVGLARALRRAGEPALAAEALAVALELDPDHPAAHQLMGLTLRQLGQEERARVHLARLRTYAADIIRDPWLLDVQKRAVTVDAQLDFARSFIAAGRLDSALRLLTALAERFPNRAEVFRRLGETHARAGRLPEAGAAYARALDLEPHDASTRSAYAENLLLQGDPARAGAEAARALRDDPDDVNAAVIEAAALLRGGQPQPAAERLRAITAARGDHLGAWYWLGEALLALSAREQAIRAYERAVELQPGWPAAQRRLDALRRPSS